MNYASWGTRVGAYLVDGLVVLPIYLIGWLVDRPQVDAETGVASGGGAIYWLFALIGFLVSAYNRWFLAGKTGQSWGKKALNISLVGVDSGQPIGAGKAFLRDLAHIIDTVICYIGYLFPLWDSQKQTLADKIVKTVVVKA
ncbi:RDD family protein [Solwaraspora sp. WMMD1047]|uniref:RDD family protein n=1 Tax=Solwaraspora sp. WMMD1047 TaxID=3016102 RepID=UPI002415D40D|nr:RDD family protein [Solwaraspora sp. WMMD1047]MDG4834003.1 RDD family protein [Solwaraspora sp. WMMD1047]